jgi:hypothetical protein
MGLVTAEFAVQFLAEADIVLLSITCILAVGPTWPPIQWVLGAHCQGVVWLEHEANNSPSSNAEG